MGCMKTVSVLLLLSHVHTCARINVNRFVRQSDFDGYICELNQLKEFGYRLTRISCSVVCTNDARCSSFFYNIWNQTCFGSVSVYANTGSCDVNGGTVYYIEGTTLLDIWLLNHSSQCLFVCQNTFFFNH